MKFDDRLEALSRYEIRRSIELLNQRALDVRAEMRRLRAELEDLAGQRKTLINHRNALRDAAKN